MSIWRKKVMSLDNQKEFDLGVAMDPIGDKATGGIALVSVDLGVGVPFSGSMTWDEATAFAEALKNNGWVKDPEGTGWKL